MADSDKAWALVQDAILAFGSEVPDIAKARAALLAVLSEKAWQSYIPPIGRPCEYDEFGQWVKEKVPRGLDTTVENLLSIADGDTRLRDALDQALQRPGGRPTQTFDNVQGSAAPTGNSETAALRRLRKKAPGLHARVLLPKGDPERLSAHAAMVTAGLRPKTVSVPIGRPERVAAYLRRHMPNDIARLVEILSTPGNPSETGRSSK